MARPKLYEEKRIPTAVRIPESLHRELQSAAEERDVSVNFLILRAIKRHLEQLSPVDEVREDRPA
jgi:predicted HicB family RNase H-like nuclease